MYSEKQDYAERHRNFEHWFQTPLGRALIADQRRCIDQVLAGVMPGDRLLQVGLSHRLPLTSALDFTHKFMTTSEWGCGIPDGAVVCDSDELPFPSESMDLVILHHSADFSAYPHQVVREACRVLKGGGQLLHIGFNPLSIWGLRKLLSRCHSGPWGGRFILKSRMEDWLRLLDLGVDRSGSYFLHLPLNNLSPQGDLRWLTRIGGQGILPVGAYYCILATKRVGSPIKVQRNWRRSNVITLPGTTAIGASRGCIRDNGGVNG
ncbi:class I SAM-dependent methyltransferase [Marinobacter mobilis]|uniref:Methyltransferase domain-containing protein n=1 Tax=Marinobacter mobilis TaxID=488533 RepID=A0A1H2V6S2_9GAMM|nr:class I SAM-dependent methyltransferase [Marinobacter mobilis]SDW63599.1 Methyltransferase domain-containing protein [Marinobacter mobilis]